MARRNVYGLVLAGLIAAVVPACVGSGLDEENSIEQDVTAPTLSATATGPNNISLSWNGITSATKYYIFRSSPGPGGESYLTSTVPTSYNDGHLAAGQQYCYFVEAVVGGIASGPSNEVCATTNGAPQPPTGVTATPVSTTRINVTWNAVTGAIKYYVYMSTNGGAYAYLATTTTNSYVAANLTANINYCFEVAVVTSNGTSANSSPGCSGTFTGGLEGWWKLNEKTGITAMDSSGLNRTGSISGATYSTTDRPPVADDFSTLAFTGATTSKVSVPNAPALNAGGPFTVAFWVKLTNAGTGTVNFIGKRAASCGAITWQISQNASGLQFNGGTGTTSFGGSVPLNTWTHVAVSLTGGNGNAARFYINGALVRSAAYTLGAATTAPLELGNSGDCGSSGGAFLLDEIKVYSSALTDAQIADLGTPPQPPTGLAGTSPGQTSVNLTWNSVTNAQKYFVWRSTTSGSETNIATATGTSYTDTHLTANTQYFYEVSVQAHGLLSTTSSEISVTTLPPPPPPTGVTATAGTTGRINITWTASTGATKYYVYQSAAGGAYTFLNTVFAPTTSYTATGLTSGTNYCYEVRDETSPGVVSDFSTPSCVNAP